MRCLLFLGLVAAHAPSVTPHKSLRKSTAPAALVAKHISQAAAARKDPAWALTATKKEDPKEGSVQEGVDDMLKEMCKDRPDYESCKGLDLGEEEKPKEEEAAPAEAAGNSTGNATAGNETAHVKELEDW